MPTTKQKFKLGDRVRLEYKRFHVDFAGVPSGAEGIVVEALESAQKPYHIDFGDRQVWLAEKHLTLVAAAPDAVPSAVLSQGDRATINLAGHFHHGKVGTVKEADAHTVILDLGGTTIGLPVDSVVPGEGLARSAPESTLAVGDRIYVDDPNDPATIESISGRVASVRTDDGEVWTGIPLSKMTRLDEPERVTEVSYNGITFPTGDRVRMRETGEPLKILRLGNRTGRFISLRTGEEITLSLMHVEPEPSAEPEPPAAPDVAESIGQGDRVRVVASDHPFAGKVGVVVCSPRKNGTVNVRFEDDLRTGRVIKVQDLELAEAEPEEVEAIALAPKPALKKEPRTDDIRKAFPVGSRVISESNARPPSHGEVTKHLTPNLIEITWENGNTGAFHWNLIEEMRISKTRKAKLESEFAETYEAEAAEQIVSDDSTGTGEATCSKCQHSDRHQAPEGLALTCKLSRFAGSIMADGIIADAQARQCADYDAEQGETSIKFIGLPSDLPLENDSDNTASLVIDSDEDSITSSEEVAIAPVEVIPAASDDVNLDWLAQRINEKHREVEEAFSTALAAACEAGQMLAEARSRIAQDKSRSWLRWLEENFAGSRSTAYNYLKVAENWDQIQISGAQGDSLRQVLKMLRKEQADGMAEPVQPAAPSSPALKPLAIAPTPSIQPQSTDAPQAPTASIGAPVAASAVREMDGPIDTPPTRVAPAVSTPLAPSEPPATSERRSLAVELDEERYERLLAWQESMGFTDLSEALLNLIDTIHLEDDLEF